MAVEKLMTLIHAVAVSDDPDKDDIYELILDQTGNLIRYVDAVYAQMTQLPIIRRRYEGQELRDRTAALDERRTAAHNSAIRSCETLNRICDVYGVGHLCMDDLSDRRAVGDFIGAFVDEIFRERI